MIGKSDLRPLVKDALTVLQSTKPDDFFTPDVIINIVQDRTGKQLHDGAFDEVKTILCEQWGNGIEPVTIGGHVWKFGLAKRPVSQEIKPPR